jgi:predicted GIY-YIG superfamily endonuclease
MVRHPSILRLNPNREPAKPCVYVGMTGLSVEQRFENHKKGRKSAWIVRKYGLRLMPELYAFLNPMPFEAAAQMERDWQKICERMVILSPVVHRDNGVQIRIEENCQGKRERALKLTGSHSLPFGGQLTE